MTSDGLLLRLPWRATLRRLPQVVFGLWLFGTGIAMMVAADFGLPPWDVFHQGVARTLDVSLGTVIIATGVVIVLAFVPLKERIGLGTVLNAVLVGVAVDTTLRWLGRPDAMWLRLALCAAGPVVVGLASGLYLAGGLGPGPRDGLMTGIGRRGFTIWKVRTGIEISALALGVLLGGSIGFGTAWFALSIGPFVQFFLARLTPPPPPPPPPNG
ncbi:MAG: hypothetical protein KAI24_26040 [Planctomycetes bacterium]|nr:hypothetical protein [Planctomycetota bacterium]